MDPRKKELRKCHMIAKEQLGMATTAHRAGAHEIARCHSLTGILACLYGCLAMQQEPETESVPLPEPPSTTGAPTVVDEADLGGVAMFRTLPREVVGPLHQEMAELMGLQTEFAIGNLE